jgi:hypothetical protein
MDMDEKTALLQKLLGLLEEHRKLRENDTKTQKARRKAKLKKEQLDEDEASEFLKNIDDEEIVKARKSHISKAKKKKDGDEEDVMKKLNEKLEKKEAFLQPPKKATPKQEKKKQEDEEPILSKNDEIKMEIAEEIESEKEGKQPVKEVQQTISEKKSEIEKTIEVVSNSFAPEIDAFRVNNITQFLGSYRNKNRFL